ncbi:MAG: hypothetical protein A3J62_03485 [Candidatus Buchananbacteria bacterium RIFCSPHIGHO2_02_FULL_38_8]|uniref:Polysaccharide chain length determinant N-terminal domain-containing protein n=2 Tax=Candidatus Buchananiibacteriota TaxID=1817903 RepID=A0A1G1XSR9_9BACT|nr:MAG: hypothetical protein A2731_03575 [Candidatus Buchananbacteria bacterium RIFCSPHIGHO2_01_FULL_39_8]OGY47226.1 MAG: hypothetical protein A3J62_03485 [Candidatus Buchananbacteria bacterium RIFCSPHIGHO2_02_FULL_38_8]
MKLKLTKIKFFRIIFSLRNTYILIIIAILLALSWVVYFLYKNIYQTITQSEEIILLKQEVAPDTINMAKVNAVLESINKKTTSTESIEWEKIKNPFRFGTQEVEIDSVPVNNSATSTPTATE